MRRIFCSLLILLLITSCKAEKKDVINYEADSIRYPVFAGQFYPADSSKLTLQIKTFLDNAKSAWTKTRLYWTHVGRYTSLHSHRVNGAPSRT